MDIKARIDGWMLTEHGYYYYLAPFPDGYLVRATESLPRRLLVPKSVVCFACPKGHYYDAVAWVGQERVQFECRGHAFIYRRVGDELIELEHIEALDDVTLPPPTS
jgi:hypothetical protein